MTPSNSDQSDGWVPGKSLIAYGNCMDCGDPMNDGEMFRGERCDSCAAGNLPSWWGNHGGICRGCVVLCEDCPDG